MIAVGRKYKPAVTQVAEIKVIFQFPSISTTANSLLLSLLVLLTATTNHNINSCAQAQQQQQQLNYEDEVPWDSIMRDGAQVLRYEHGKRGGVRRMKDQPETDDSTCPCIRPRGLSECFQYDPTMAAVTLEEVIVNFSDLTNSDFSRDGHMDYYVAKRLKNAFAQNPRDCTTSECQKFKGCTQRLIGRMVQMMNPDIPNVSLQAVSQEEIRNNTLKDIMMMTKKYDLKQDQRKKCTMAVKKMRKTANRKQLTPDVQGANVKWTKRFARDVRKNVDGTLPYGNKACYKQTIDNCRRIKIDLRRSYEKRKLIKQQHSALTKGIKAKKSNNYRSFPSIQPAGSSQQQNSKRSRMLRSRSSGGGSQPLDGKIKPSERDDKKGSRRELSPNRLPPRRTQSKSNLAKRMEVDNKRSRVIKSRRRTVLDRRAAARNRARGRKSSGMIRGSVSNQSQEYPLRSSSKNGGKADGSNNHNKPDSTLATASNIVPSTSNNNNIPLPKDANPVRIDSAAAVSSPFGSGSQFRPASNAEPTTTAVKGGSFSSWAVNGKNRGPEQQQLPAANVNNLASQALAAGESTGQIQSSGINLNTGLGAGSGSSSSSSSSGSSLPVSGGNSNGWTMATDWTGKGLDIASEVYRSAASARTTWKVNQGTGGNGASRRNKRDTSEFGVKRNDEEELKRELDDLIVRNKAMLHQLSEDDEPMMHSNKNLLDKVRLLTEQQNALLRKYHHFSTFITTNNDLINNSNKNNSSTFTSQQKQRQFLPYIDPKSPVSPENSASSPGDKWTLPRSKTERFKRESSTNGDDFPVSDGYSYTAKCDYRRGNELEDGSGFVGFCNLCWKIRVMPSGYLPRFFNEMDCESKESTCLSGWARCRRRSRRQQILINRGTEALPDYFLHSIEIGVSCECQIRAGSPLHSFVAQ